MIKNKLALITGCNRGIGKSLIDSFANNKCNLICCTRKKNLSFLKYCKKLEKKFKIKIYNFYADLEKLEEAEQMAQNIVKLKKKIDIIINNAGYNYTALINSSNKQNLIKVFNINFLSVFLFNQIILRQMIKNKAGSVINISSSASDICPAGRSIYAASKAALEKFSNTLSKEYGAFNIRSNIISPGLIDTKMLWESSSKESIEKIINSLPLKKIGTKNDVVNLVLFLASDKSSYITGQNFKINGGLY